MTRTDVEAHNIISATLEGVEATYRARTPASLAAYRQASTIIPSGAPAALGHITPYPLAIQRGDGAYVWDADGNRLVDFFAGDWLLVLGHRHPAVIAALLAQSERGLTFGNPDPGLGYDYASLLQSRIPSLERVRFTTSGTEATWSALSLARNATGRGKIAKMVGGFHGTHDAVLVGSMSVGGGSAVPTGLVPGVEGSIVLLPFNDADRCEQIIRSVGDELAAVIIEPVLGGTGMVPATKEFLVRLRAATSACGAILIFDEVVTFPVSSGGAQGYYGVTDLTTMGKSVSGGLPLAAYGGRADIMELTDPTTHPELEAQYGSTLGGIPICLAVGLAQVSQLTPEVHAHLQALGDQLRHGVEGIAVHRGVPLRVTGLGHLFDGLVGRAGDRRTVRVGG